RACGKLPFAERYEPEAGGPNEGFAIRDAEKHRFMSARLHPTCECSHRVHVPREGHAHEAKLHTFSPQISRRPWWRPWWPPLFSPLRPWIRRSRREVTRRRTAGACSASDRNQLRGSVIPGLRPSGGAQRAPQVHVRSMGALPHHRGSRSEHCGRLLDAELLL